jgi:replicative DNA helicase
MASLTERAERALLGALIAAPGYVEPLEVSPGEFADERHQAVYAAIVSAAARVDGLPDMSPGQRRTAIARAGSGQVAEHYLRELEESCPNSANILAYAAMVISARLSRQLAGRAGELEYESRDLLHDAQSLELAQEPLHGAVKELSDHLAHVAAAFREHAARLGPALDAADEPRPHRLQQTTAEASQQRLEERVLSAVLQGHPEASRILSFLPVAAFTSELHQGIFRAAASLDRTSRPIDPLTVDWTRSQHHAQPGGISETDTARLAALPPSADSPLQGARALEVRLRHRAPPGATPPAGLRALLPAQQPPSRLRLVQSPPSGDLPRPGPEQRN